jgi:radical SAM superfamily enzyme YgiQ (UPF0313 family)
MVDFLFVNPPTPSPAEHSGYSVMAPPLGIGYLAACLRNAGYTVTAVDLALSNAPLEELKGAMLQNNPRIIGFYTLTQSYYATEFLLKQVKVLDPDVVTCVGGPHVSYEYETALIESGFDIVFLFEAEESIVEVAHCLLRGKGTLKEIKGIAYLQEGNIIKPPPRVRENNLDVIPYPARDIFPIHRYTRPGTIMSSRGCPMKCIFCIASTFEDAYRYRSPENVVGELRDMYEKWGINDFYFIDNVFTTHRSRTKNICKLIRQSNLPIGWYCVSRVDYVTPVLMQYLASAGCYRVELGVESADMSVINTMKKRITIEQVRRAADIILNLGMQPMFTFQVGHPDDTLDSIETTMRMIEEMRERGCGTYLSITTPYPGTPLLINRDKYEINMETWNWEYFRMSNPTYSTKNFSRNDLRKAVYREARKLQQAVAEGKVGDPPLAPWLRFENSHSEPAVGLPPPPREESMTKQHN